MEVSGKFEGVVSIERLGVERGVIGTNGEAGIEG